MSDTPSKKDNRAADQDAALESKFASGDWVDEDRRKSVEPSPIQQPPINQAIPTQGRIIPPPMPPRNPYKQPEPEKDSFVWKYLMWAALVVAVLVGIGVCRA